jgi:hypothetical protein
MNRIPDDVLRKGYEVYRATRTQLLEMAVAGNEHIQRMGGEHFSRWIASTAPDRTATASALALSYWYRCGLQSVELSHKLAAALMATSATGALDDAQLPWPAFEIRIPPGLLESSHGEVFSCFVHTTPDFVPESMRRAGAAGLMLLYYDARSIGHVGFENLATVGRFEPRAFPTTELGMMRDVLREEYDQDQEDRLKQLLARLITGVILLINEARADKPQAYPQHPLRPAKRGEPRVNTHRIERAVTIDLTANVRDFVRGDNRDAPHVTTLVRGHWRQQPHGAGRALRRKQWIMPFWRGEGPLSVRTTRLRDTEEA